MGFQHVLIARVALYRLIHSSFPSGRLNVFTVHLIQSPITADRNRSEHFREICWGLASIQPKNGPSMVSGRRRSAVPPALSGPWRAKQAAAKSLAGLDLGET
jgi:hypothetical protein